MVVLEQWPRNIEKDKYLCAYILFLSFFLIMKKKKTIMCFVLQCHDNNVLKI
jgi:hypothetical protein